MSERANRLANGFEWGGPLPEPPLYEPDESLIGELEKGPRKDPNRRPWWKRRRSS